MERDIYIHIGMPKTGTTFIQTKHFEKLPEDQISYNPRTIHAKLRELIHEHDPALFEQALPLAKAEIETELAKLPDLPILLSDEDLTLKDWQFNYTIGLNALRQLFPNAKILITLRFQPDWCLSMYKQGVQQGAYYHNFREFLQFEKGAFKPSATSPTRTNVHALDYVDFINAYRTAFGTNNVLISFYENLRHEPETFTGRIFDFIGIESAVPDMETHYRGLSAFSLKCLIGFGRLNRVFGRTVPYTYPKDGQSWIADQARRPLTQDGRWQAPWTVLAILGSRFFCTFKNWVALRDFLQRRIDKYIYLNWDIFPARSRERLKQLAHEKNAGLKELSDLPPIPSVYIKE